MATTAPAGAYQVPRRTTARSQRGEEVVYRDLAANPLPHLTLDAFADTFGARRVPRRRHDRDRRADVQFHASVPAQGVDRPHRVAGKTFRYTEERSRGPGRRQAGDHRAGARRYLQRGLAGRRTRALETYLRGVSTSSASSRSSSSRTASRSAPSSASSRSRQAFGETFASRPDGLTARHCSIARQVVVTWPSLSPPTAGGSNDTIPRTLRRRALIASKGEFQ